MPRRYFSLIFLSLIPPIDTSSGYLSFKRFIETLADAFWVPAADFIHFFSVLICARLLQRLQIVSFGCEQK